MSINFRASKQPMGKHDGDHDMVGVCGTERPQAWCKM